MAADAANRETIRDALATLLTAALVGVGLPCAEVLNYDAADIKAPSVRVLSGGSARRMHGMGTEKYRNTFRMAIKTYVSAASTDDSWTEQNVEDTLDLIDKMIADVVMDNIQTANWKKLMYAPEITSTIVPAIPVSDAGGNPYLLEETVLIAEVYDGS